MLNPTLLASLGSAAGSAAASSFGSSGGSGLGGALFGGISAKRQWKYVQKQMALQQQYALEQMAKSAEYQLAHDRHMFDYENAYNEPTKVFERFAAAGINPAAVLGSSGASVGATIGTGSGSAPSASGPSGGSGAIGASPAFTGNPLAIAQNALIKSQADKADADARLSSAEATRVERETQGSDYYAQLAELNRQLLSHKVTTAAAMADYQRAHATIEQSSAQFADFRATYDFQNVVSAYAKTVEEYRRLKAENDATIPVMEQLVAADLTLKMAQAHAAESKASLDQVMTDVGQLNLRDLQNWFSVNWDTPVDVPEVNEKGKPTGKVVKMTGRQIQEYLLGLGAASASQDLPARWFNIRSQKNQFGYSIAKTAIGAAVAVGVAKGTRGIGGAPADYEQTTSHSDRHGEFIGGTSVRRSYLPRR